LGFDKIKTLGTAIATSKDKCQKLNKMKIVIINYGAGNIQSIMFAIERLGFKAVLSNNPDEIKAADKVIFQEWERLVQR
jgi:hypothetical protein